jgi:lysophospholipase L1-like esterase
VLSPIPRNRWTNGKVDRAAGWHGGWAKEVAHGEGVPFVDLNEIVARQYEASGKEKVDPLFGGDWTHTNAAGADLNAASVVSGLKGLKDCALCAYLSDKAKDAPPFAMDSAPGAK